MLSRILLRSMRAGSCLCACGRTTFKISAPKQLALSSGFACRSLSTQGKQLAQCTQGLKRFVSSVRSKASAATSPSASRAFPDISEHAQKVVGRWLLLCSGMVVGAVVLGGVTRLTESGLSITKWDLITGMKPPLTEAEWEMEFEKYKQFPEFKYLERELSMSDFKFIYFMEWFHRIWGRAVGLAFILPAAYFWRRGFLSRKMKPRIIIYGGLIMLQGLLGIFMVRSGLEEKSNPTEMPRVSQYRLCSHFGAAVVLYTLMFWQALTHLLPPNQLKWTSQVARLSKMSHGAMALVFITALSGAFVAGIDAGLVYNSWPKFADRWIPTDLFAHSPTWRNFFENHTTVQFNHRHLGEVTGLFILALWVLSRRVTLPPRARLASHVLLAMAFVQIGLGIQTLLSFVPTHLAASHQSGSLALLSAALWLAHELRKMPK